MKEPRFNFQPFELDSEFDGNPHAFTKAFWQDEERELALALVDGYVRFCEADKLESGEWNFAISERVPKTSKDAEVDAEFLKIAFHRALEKGDVGRLLYMAPSDLLKHRNKATQHVFIEMENKGFIRSEAMPSVCSMLTEFYIRSPFFTSASISITENAIADLYAEVQKWLVDRSSDFSFSSRWNQLYDFEKSKLVTVFKNGNSTEMDEIASLILSLNVSPFGKPEMSSPTYGLHFKMATREAPTKLKSIYATYDWSKSRVDPQQIRYGLWDVFIKHFGPRLNPELREKYTVLEFFDDYFWYGKAKTDGAALTSHVRMEICLQLSEWLQGKVPDDQIDSLLG